MSDFQNVRLPKCPILKIAPPPPEHQNVQNVDYRCQKCDNYLLILICILRAPLKILRMAKRALVASTVVETTRSQKPGLLWCNQSFPSHISCLEISTVCRNQCRCGICTRSCRCKLTIELFADLWGNEKSSSARMVCSYGLVCSPPLLAQRAGAAMVAPGRAVEPRRAARCRASVDTKCCDHVDSDIISTSA